MLLDRQMTDVKAFLKFILDEVKQEIREVRLENEEMKRSLEFTQEKLDKASSTIVEQQKKIEQLELQPGVGSGELGERLRCLEDYSRKNNLIIDGIPEPSGETTETLQSSIQMLFNEKLKLKPEIDNLHRIGSKGNKSDNRPRSVIIRMTKFHHRQECLKSSPKLKGN